MKWLGLAKRFQRRRCLKIMVIYMSCDLRKPASMTYRTFYVKHQKLLNLTSLNVALKPIRANSKIKPANILIKCIRYHAICCHGNGFILATVRIFKVWSVILRPCKLEAKIKKCQLICDSVAHYGKCHRV